VGLSTCPRNQGKPTPFRQLLKKSLNAGHLGFHGLVPIGAGVDLHGGEDAGSAHGVHRLVAGLNGSEHRLPLPLDRRAVGMPVDREAGFQQHPNDTALDEARQAGGARVIRID